MSQNLLLKIFGLEKLLWENKVCKRCGQEFVAKKSYWEYCYNCLKDRQDVVSKTIGRFMNISTFSLLAHCQRCFLTDYLGLRKETHAMIEGTKFHEKFEKGKPISEEKMLDEIKSGVPNFFSKVFISDSKNRLKGRLDGLSILGKDGNKTKAVVVELKTFRGLPKIYSSHSLQLSSYALTIANDERFRKILKIIGGNIILQNRDNGKIEQQLEINNSKLNSWMKPIPKLLRTVDSLVSRKIDAEEKFFDLETRKWKNVDDDRWHKCDLLDSV